MAYDYSELIAQLPSVPVMNLTPMQGQISAQVRNVSNAAIANLAGRFGGNTSNPLYLALATQARSNEGASAASAFQNLKNQAQQQQFSQGLAQFGALAGAFDANRRFRLAEKDSDRNYDLNVQRLELEKTQTNTADELNRDQLALAAMRQLSAGPNRLSGLSTIYGNNPVIPQRLAQMAGVPGWTQPSWRGSRYN